MQINRVHPSAFPREGYMSVGSLGIVAEEDIKHLVPVVGSDCLECGETFTAGDRVTLVRDIYGVAWVHDAHIREEVAG